MFIKRPEFIDRTPNADPSVSTVKYLISEVDRIIWPNDRLGLVYIHDTGIIGSIRSFAWHAGELLNGREVFLICEHLGGSSERIDEVEQGLISFRSLFFEKYNSAFLVTTQIILPVVYNDVYWVETDHSLSKIFDCYLVDPLSLPESVLPQL